MTLAPTYELATLALDREHAEELLGEPLKREFYQIHSNKRNLRVEYFSLPDEGSYWLIWTSAHKCVQVIDN